ncbi:MAG: hypothetical protein JO111_18280 [Caulobacteraceae bacterium]|nr:hypothetical protein [Caulobacteraceae bacterium]
MIPVFGLSLLFSIALCVHVVRTRQEMWWLLIILMLQPLGGIVYLVAIVLPGAFGSTTARRASAAARAQLDPGRDYREAAADLSQTPTVQNQMRLAKAAASLGRHEEAERLYAQAAQGIHADDPVLLLGRAQALNELRRYDEALAVLARLETDADGGASPQAALAYARAYDGLGRQAEAEEAYRSAVERLPGLEAMARFAAFLARTGRGAQARDLITEMDRHIDRAAPQFRKEYRGWRDLAARALA